MKTVIITGASGNLGQSAVKKFISEGYQVIGTVVPNDPVQIQMETGSDRLEKVVVDLVNEEDAQQFVDDIISRYGTIDAAVLTVGSFAMGKIADTSTADIAKQYKLNFETAYNIARPVFIQMIKQGKGRIFMIGSRPGLDSKSSKGMIAYGLGKSLIFRLAELMNEEAKGLDVVTTVIVPGTIDTPQNRKAMPDANTSNWVKAEDIASVIQYFCTDEASAIREPVIKLYKNA